jgi:hypothetical protein
VKPGTGIVYMFGGVGYFVGAAGGGAIGGLLLALSGYGALAIGVPLFGLASAALAWRR